MTGKLSVGIIDIEIYYPKLYVDEKELEQMDNCSGKYTLGLGQNEMAVCPINEDSVSLALTVVHRMMTRKELSYSQIGRLDVGTETPVDISKSIKSHLMQLFDGEKNFSVEGADNINACYGGTAALFNCINWIESSSWDGRYAMVVTTDIANYSNDNPGARATGGAAAVCMLVGPNPSLAIDSYAKGVYMRNYYDFYKPLKLSYPVVDGKLSLWCYVSSLLMCSTQFVLNQRKMCKEFDLLNENNLFVFHCPYTKLVQKGLIYMFYFYKNLENFENLSEFDTLLSFIENLLNDPKKNSERIKFEKDMISSFSKINSENYDKMIQMSKRLGNSYCSSLYVCLSSLIGNFAPSDLSRKNLILYSYGSGSLSSMFLLHPSGSKEILKSIHDYCSTKSEELSLRIKISPQNMAQISSDRATLNENKKLIKSVEMHNLAEHSFFLSDIDEMDRRFYSLYNQAE